MIPERATIFDFCFEKKASGNWCDWMDTIDKSTLTIPATAKVNYRIERILLETFREQHSLESIDMQDMQFYC